MIKSSRFIRLALLSGCATLVCAAPARAQSDTPPGGTATQARPSSGTPGDADIVVTARRKVERLLDVPVAATVVDQTQLRQHDLTSVANIKIAVPEISLDRGFTGSGTSITLRGVSSSALDPGVEQSVLIDMDGMAISRGRLVNDAMFDINTISVLKGPQALFFGKNSPGGVVSIQSANPTSRFTAFLRAGYEFTSRNPQIEGAISGPLTDSLGARLAFYSSNSQGYIINQDSGVVDAVRNQQTGSTYVPAAPHRLGAEQKLAGRLTLAYDNGSPFTANFKLLFSHYRNQGIQAFSEVMGCPTTRSQPGTVGGVLDPTGDCKLNNRSSQGWLSPTIIAAWPEVRKYAGGQPYGKNDSVLPVLTMNYKMKDVMITSVTGYYNYDYVTQGNADATSYSYFWSYSNEKNSSFYQDIRIVSNFDGRFNFATGGHYEHNNRTAYVGAASGSLPMDPLTGRYEADDNQQHNKSEAYSLFAQGIVKITPALELAGGARFTHQVNDLNSFNTFVNPAIVTTQLAVGQHIQGSKSQHNISPEATLTWHPTHNTTLYGAYKTGFLAGGFSNPGTLAPTSAISNLSFDPEKVTGVELGAKGAFLNNRLTGSLTLYRYIYKGLPLTSLIALSNNSLTYVTQNAASTVSQGVEFESSLRLTPSTTLNGTAAYTDAHFESFTRAQCYTGQTVAQGCVPTSGSTGFVQNLSGRAVYRAPSWIASAGITQQIPLSAKFKTSLNADLRYSSGYYTGLNLNPLSYQPGYTVVNAGVRLSSQDDRYSLAVIGRNLTNRIYGTLGIDKPGGVGEVFTVAGEPRAVVLQVELKY
ncbi:TonB-dependent receptor [Novosphingobium rosa]|uniref:TonB-dependent receptor n=1 Tax=Novosphingobium rosa TaxID=76978 RepID=UPI00082B1A03|nr:TonB-dependent receptor [Novosphingobium rosa]